MAAAPNRSIGERLARVVWWTVIKLMRWGHIKGFNHKVARHLDPEHAKRFVERGKVQNAFARRHAVTVIRFAMNLVLLALLCSVLFWVAQWLFAHGYLSAPGSPKRTID